jgi:hypothetical protein
VTLASVPSDVAALLGPHPEERSGEGECRVLAGRGLVAKFGPRFLVEREVWVLRQGELPVAVPELVAGGPGWLVVPEVTDTAESWSEEDLRGALADLASLHQAFQDGPLEGPLRRITEDAGVDALLEDGRRSGTPLPPPLDRLLDDPTPLLEVLRSQPVTLLHGDPWPGNVRRPRPGRRVWIDWEQASAGPAAADLASWLDQTPWFLGRDIDPGADLDHYLEARGNDLHRPDFTRVVDAASVLWFLAFDVPRLPTRATPEQAAAMTAARQRVADRLLG